MGENSTNKIHLHDDQVEEVQETLSLSNFPLDLDSNSNPENDQMEKMSGQSRNSSSEAAPEFFEFLSDLSSDMCPADDIIFCGKLIPLKQQPVSFQTQKDHFPFEEKKKIHVLRKRSESLSELRSCSIARSNSTKANTLLRNSRSLDYQKLHHYYMERNPSTRSVGKTEVSPKKAVKPRWYVFMFGMIKVPTEMDLKDIKSRQFRRNQTVMFSTEEEGAKKFGGNRSSGKGSSWSLLKALSCRDHTSIAVTTSFWTPQA
ncbi:hypothetical protein REPUB_Repub03eG0136600 [Reevesia pubescens]